MTTKRHEMKTCLSKITTVFVVLPGAGLQTASVLGMVGVKVVDAFFQSSGAKTVKITTQVM